jgi:hypothetical protein
VGGGRGREGHKKIPTKYFQHISHLTQQRALRKINCNTEIKKTNETAAFWDAALCVSIDAHEHPVSIFYTEDGVVSIKLNSVASHASAVVLFTTMKSSNLKSKTIKILKI